MHAVVRLVIVAGMAGSLFSSCSGRDATSPTLPSPVALASPMLGAEAAESLPLGTATVSEAACPAGSKTSTLCVRLAVDCPSIAPASALLRVTAPTADRRGTIVLSTGGAGTLLNGVIGRSAQMIAGLNGLGMVTVEIAWAEPGIWGGPQPRTLACRYATAARVVFDTFHAHDPGALFAAQGTSGGSSQIAFALAHYGLSDIIELANLGGGPPGCPLCSPDGIHRPEPLLPGPPPSLNRDPQLLYPTTIVRFFLGANEPTPSIITDATAFHDAIVPLDKSMTIVPGTAHNIEETEAGVNAFVESVRATLSTRVTSTETRKH